MAFDRNDPADLAALKAELQDPKYTGGTANILSLLNDPANNPGGEVGSDYLTTGNLLAAVMGASINSQDQFKIQLMFEASTGLDDDMSNYRLAIIALGGQLASSVQSIQRALSRAEVLFSDIDANGVQESVQLTTQDYVAARDYNG